ncbi:hypothetical protein BCO_0900026 (plasmid) [Borrelia coriaceae ATCC 43381]|uniref:Uncharacterized protein n=1 Tax=Borrelia coriaceae ATCC 43381 TaxID=1408429 RepID=W5SW63_9SPIR|nr:hypothetical protein BCO_0900026 [Borrelia coriaceae ATCC 43381]
MYLMIDRVWSLCYGLNHFSILSINGMELMYGA